MKLSHFHDVLQTIEDFADPLWPISPGYLKRIHKLIDDSQDRWQELYDLTSDAEIVYCPWQIGIPEDDWDEEQRNNRDHSVVEILIDNVEELSGNEWFNCSPSTWLGIFAASILGNGISMYQLISNTISVAECPPDQELLDHLPLQMPANYLKANEALIAAQALRVQDQLLRRARKARAAQGGYKKNRKFVDTHEKFFKFYLANSHLSRAEAARRFNAKLNASLGPNDSPLYRNEECAVRALRGALKAAGI